MCSEYLAILNRRSGRDHQQFSYTANIPERRSGKDRRSRKGNYLLNIEDDGILPQEKVLFKKY